MRPETCSKVFAGTGGDDRQSNRNFKPCCEFDKPIQSSCRTTRVVVAKPKLWANSHPAVLLQSCGNGLPEVSVSHGGISLRPGVATAGREAFRRPCPEIVRSERKLLLALRRLLSHQDY